MVLICVILFALPIHWLAWALKSVYWIYSNKSPPPIYHQNNQAVRYHWLYNCWFLVLQLFNPFYKHKHKLKMNYPLSLIDMYFKIFHLIRNIWKVQIKISLKRGSPIWICDRTLTDPSGCQHVRCLSWEPTVTAWFNSIMKYRSNNFYPNMIFQSWPGTTMALQHNIGFMILIILIPLPLDSRKYIVCLKT